MKILNLGLIKVTLDFRTLHIGFFMLQQFTLRCCKHQGFFPQCVSYPSCLSLWPSPSLPCAHCQQNVVAPYSWAWVFRTTVVLGLTIWNQVLPRRPSVWYWRALAPTAPGAGPAPPPDNNTTAVCSLLHYTVSVLYSSPLRCTVLLCSTMVWTLRRILNHCTRQSETLHIP